MTIRIILVITGLLFASVVCADEAQKASVPEPPVAAHSSHKDPAASVSIAKDVVNILFFIAVGTIAILSYLQARKTVFTPLRTEIFKQQLRAFEDVLQFFEKHPSLHIVNEFDYNKILHLNALKMLDSYGFLFFENEIDLDAMKKHREPLFADLIGAVVSKNFMMKHFKTPEATKSEEKSGGKMKPEVPALLLAEWQQYEHGMIEFTKDHQNAMEKVRKFTSSPLLPGELKRLIREFEKAAVKNLSEVGEVLTELAKELPTKYPNLESLKNADLSWIWNTYNHRKNQLTKPQEEILAYLNSYLDIDSVLPTKA